MNFYLKRTWDVVISLFAIALSFILQFIFFGMLSMGAAGISEVSGLSTIKEFPAGKCIIFFFVLFNGLACWEYFRKRRHASVIDGESQIVRLAVGPDSGHLTGAIFLVPRGIDRIFTGTELTMQKPEEEQAAEPAKAKRPR